MKRYNSILWVALLILLLSESCGSIHDSQEDEHPMDISGTLFYLPLTEDKIFSVILPNNKKPDLIYATPARQKERHFEINSLSCGPNGTLLFHVRHTIEETSSSPRKEITKIVMLNPMTKEITDLACGDANMRFPVLSSDKSKLATSGGGSIFVKDIKTGVVVHFSQFGEQNQLVIPWSWSPDGKLLALTTAHIGKSPTIYFLDIYKNVLLPWVNGMEPHFSHSGQLIAYLSLDYKELVIADKDGKTKQTFNAHQFRHLNGWLGDDKVLFTRSVVGYITRIGIADLRSGKLSDLKVPDANEISGVCFHNKGNDHESRE
jgi:Tol biopolymer transport system component